MPNLSIYVYHPYCAVRCAYCHFNTYAGLSHLIVPYARALASEIQMVGRLTPHPGRQAGEGGEVHTLFFGGGTPSLLPLDSYADIFAALRTRLTWPLIARSPSKQTPARSAAHGCAGGWRYSNVLAPGVYISRIGRGGKSVFPVSPAVVHTNPVTVEDAMSETMMLAMRLTHEGVRDGEFHERFGLTLNEKYRRELNRLKQLGLIEWDAQGARLTSRGRLLGNRVFREFV